MSGTLSNTARNESSVPSNTSNTSNTSNREAAIVDEHLPQGYTADLASESATPTPTADSEESSLRLQGGDIHRDLFKINARRDRLVRSQTTGQLASIRPEGDEDVSPGSMTIAEQRQPQGFRRQYLVRRQTLTDFAGGSTLPVTRNFVDFLNLYGSFAGEDLAETDEDNDDDDDESSTLVNEGGQDAERDDREATETRPLLLPRKSSRFVGNKPGNAGTVKTFFTLIKAFVGTGIMFLPKAFNNGGILFSSMTLLAIAGISMFAFHLLLQCRVRVGGSYGEIGHAIAGKAMRDIILGSIVLSQLGFVCTGLVFVSDNWHSFLQAVTHGANPVSTTLLIVIQAVAVIPLSFIRDISRLGFAATIADAFILVGLIYIWYYTTFELVTNGMAPSVVLFNPNAYSLTIGASIFTFEGIGLIIPIHASMRSPAKFEWLLGLVMLIITVIFASVGALCYATFGSDTQIEVINNLPQDSPVVNTVQFMYSLAVLIGNPVQLFPAIRILEGMVFGRHSSGRKDPIVKWKKNLFRAGLVALCVAVAIGGSKNLDRFVALIGSLACVPLVYIWPPFLHYRAVAETRREKVADVVLMVLGAVGMVYTTSLTVMSSFAATTPE